MEKKTLTYWLFPVFLFCFLFGACTDVHAQRARKHREGLLKADSIRAQHVADSLALLDTLSVAKKGGATTISVTRYGANRLSREADISLFVASSEMLVRSAAMTSRIAMMHVVDILYSAVAAQGYDRYKPFLDKTHLAGREKRRSQHERRR